MKNVLFLLIVTSIASAVYCEEPSKKENLAVAEFSGKNVSQADASIVSDFLRTELVKNDDYVVVEKANMEKILAEAAFQQTGCTSSDCAVQLGKILNVHKMVVGSVSKLEGIYAVNANLVDVETGKIERSNAVTCEKPAELISAAENLADKLTDSSGSDKTTLAGNKVYIVLSPKLGFFTPLDPKVKHNGNLSTGADLTLWTSKTGFCLEYGNYSENNSNVMKQDILYPRNGDNFIDTYGNLIPLSKFRDPIGEDLRLVSWQFGILRKIFEDNAGYIYLGAGAGNLLATNVPHDQILTGPPYYPRLGDLDGSFTSYFVKAGIKYGAFGALFEYTYVPTNNNWSNVNFMGYSLNLSYNFTINLNMSSLFHNIVKG